MKAPRILTMVVVLALVGRASGQTLTTLYQFSGGTDGHNPVSGLIQASDGYFYGTTGDGEPEGGYGTLFQISSEGTLTTLYSFGNGADGGYPSSALIQGTDGFLYGVTSGGGTNGGYGTVFKITPAGNLTTLYCFNGTDGNFPRGRLVQGSDGNLYGTTIKGGTNDLGTVFKITPAGDLTTLYCFNGTDGFYPYAGPVQADDGYFYGTTEGGGAKDWGTVFKITADGKLRNLYSFSNGADGGGPFAALVWGGDGHFYGTTASGGTNHSGTVFKINRAGRLKTLYRFSGGTDGANPEGTLVRGSDGNFYGTTSYGGAYGWGTAFKITPAGTLTTLHQFSNDADGGIPYGELIQGADGSFYGTAWTGGTNGVDGTVFKLSVPLNSTPHRH